VYAEITGVVWVVPRRTITKSFFFFRLHFSRRAEPSLAFRTRCGDEEEERKEEEEEEEKKSFICSRIYVFIYCSI
jgi:hypothetical protein